MEVIIHLSPYIASFLISFLIGAYAWRHRSVPCAKFFAAIAFAEFFYTFLYIFELLSPSLEAKIFWDNIEWIPSLIIPITLFAFVLSYTGMNLIKPKAIWISIYGIFFFFIVLVFIDMYYPILRSSPHLVPGGPFSALIYEFTFTSLIMVIYIYVIGFSGLFLLLKQSIHGQHLYRAQALTILFGLAFPLIGSTLTVFGLSPAFQQDTTPFTFTISNLIIAWGLFRFRLLDVVPMARNVVIEEMTDAIFIIDSQNRLVDLNPSAVKLAGKSAKEVIGKQFEHVFTHWQDFVDKYKNKNLLQSEIVIEETNQKRFYDVSISPLHNQHQLFSGNLLVVRDITEKKQIDYELEQYRDHLEESIEERTNEIMVTNKKLQQEIRQRQELEEQFRHVQKMEAIGRLAGGIAHDFNNLLTIILGYTDLLLLNFKEDDLKSVDLREIKKSTLQAENLVKQLLAFSRKQVLQPIVINLNDIIKDLEKMLNRLISENITIIKDLMPDIGLVKVDPGQIQQVIMNLVINARDAMPEGGQLSIKTENIFFKNMKDIKDIEMKPGAYVLLTISDTGIGMDKETKEKIFDPFFTTKEKEKGTGLGLATVHGIIKQSEGSIQVISEPGQGTTFNIYLPFADEQEIKPKIEKPSSNIQDGSNTILLVDDDNQVRSIARIILTQNGYNVLEADSSEKAIQLYSQVETPIHLLITDIVMPGKSNGLELASRIRLKYPDIRVIYMSGYMDIMQKVELKSDMIFLQKPFTSDSLMQKVNEALYPRIL